MNPLALTATDRAHHPAPLVGMHALGLYAAMGTLAAVIRACRTGKGALIEVAAADCAAHWRPDGVDAVLNAAMLHERPDFLDSRGRQVHWPRLFRYDTRDCKGLFFQAYGHKFWERFCAAVGRPDLLACYSSAESAEAADQYVFEELSKIFPTRTRAEWMSLFLEHDIPGGPANTLDELAADPHFLARHNTYPVAIPGAGTLHLTATPIKTPDQSFRPEPAPRLSQHTNDVLTDLLELDHADIERLRQLGAIF
jgi:crotonobetainyl-CoA:carnitine CoA-transferase CaiB-like acyl-CoA transferase